MSEKTKSQSEIDAEIKALEACKAYVPVKSEFKERNHWKIDVQIDYLLEELTDGDFQDLGDSLQDAFWKAQNWLYNDGVESPSSEWDKFKPKQA